MDKEQNNRAAMIAFKKQWDSKAGKDVIARMKELRESNLLAAMNIPAQVANPAEWALTYASRAAGIQIVLDEIQRVNQILATEKKEGGSLT